MLFKKLTYLLLSVLILAGSAAYAGPEASILLTVTVDSETISGISDSPDAFSPNGDGLYDSVLITCKINSSAVASLKIYDLNNNLIRTLRDNVAVPAGTYTTPWDGRNENGIIQPEGEYGYRIIADISGQVYQAQGSVIIDNHFMRIIEPSAGSIVAGEVTLRAIPSLHTAQENNVRFYASLKGSSDWNVIDSSNPPQKQADGSWTQVVDTLGALNGVFEISVGADYFDRNSQPRTEYAEPIEITIRNSIRVSSVTIAPNAFSPNSDNQSDSSTIKYNLNNPASVSIKIFDQDNNLVRTLKENVSESIGQNSAVWDGRNESAVFVSEGTYACEISAVDSLDGATDTARVLVVIDNNFMRVIEPAEGSEIVKNVTLVADPSAGTQNERNVVFSYSLQGSGIWVNIPGPAQKQANGTWSVNWNVDALALGNYELRVQAEYYDLNGDFRSEDTRSFAYSIPDYVKISGVENAPNAFSPNGDDDFDANTLSYNISRDSQVSVRVLDENNNIVRVIKANLPERSGVQSVLWDGKDDLGNTVPDNTYTYLIEAVDADTYQAQYSESVVVDNNFVYFEPAPGANISGQVTIKAFPSAFANFSGGGMAFYFRKFGEENWSFIGPGQKQGDGSYAVNLDVSNFENYNYEITCSASYMDLNGLYRHEDSPPAAYLVVNGIGLFKVSDTPDPFTPNADGKYDAVSIDYEIANFPGNVSVRVYDHLNNLLRTVKENAPEDTGMHSAVWDGNSDSGNIAPDGLYKYVVAARDSSDRTVQKEGEVTLIANPLTVIPVDNSVLNDTVTVSAMPSGFCRSISGVYFYFKHKYLPQYYLNLGKGTLQNDNSWSVSLDTAGLIDGLYDLRATVYYRDISGQSCSDTLLLSYEVANNNLIAEVSDSPDPFSPNADERYDYSQLKFTLGIESDLNIQVKDGNNNIVRVLKESEHTQPGYYTNVLWDGKNDSGESISDGRYVYEITAEHNFGHRETVQAFVNLDTQIASFVDPMPGSALKGVANLKIQPSLALTDVLGISVYANGTQFANASQNPDKTWSVSWDTRLKISGTYKLKAYVTYLDESGNTRSEFTPEAEFAIINGIAVSWNAFSPNNDGNYDRAQISYSPAQSGQSTIRIYDSGNNLIRTLNNNEPVASGDNAVVWDGRNDAGICVSDGEYNYKIDVNYYGGGSEHEEGAITVDNQFMRFISPDPADPLSGTASISLQASPYITDESAFVFYYRRSGALDWKTAPAVYSSYSNDIRTWAWDTSTISNGDYEVRLFAKYRDLNGFWRGEYTLPRTFHVANEFSLSKISVSLNAFSPNGDGEYDSTSISYFLNAPGTVSVKIYDLLNNLVRELAKDLASPAGSNSVEWNGQDAVGRVVPDGEYGYVISAISVQADTAEAQNTVCVDNNAVRIDAPVPDSMLSANTDFIIRTSAFARGFNYARLRIFPIGKEYIGEKQIDGSFKVALDTSTIPNGAYDFQAYGVYYDLNGKQRGESSALVSFTIHNEPPDITNLKAIPNPFSPDESGTWLNPDTGEVFQEPGPGLVLDDITEISFKASGPGFFDIGIYDKNGQLIIKLADQQFFLPDVDTGEIKLTWDGKWQNGVVPNGKYDLRVNPGSESKMASLEIVVDKLLSINNAMLTPNPFSPSMSEHNRTDISFTITDNAYLTIGVYKDNVLIKSIADHVWASAGYCFWSWDGRDDQSELVSAGAYTLKINAKTELDTDADHEELKVFVANFADVAISNSSINPYLGGTVEISYYLGQPGVYSLKIFDDNGLLVRNLLSSAASDSGKNVVVWDGRDDFGQIVLDGAYHFILEEIIDGAAEVVYDPRGTEGANVSHALSLSVTDFSSFENKFCVLSYQIPESVYHTIRIRSNRYLGPAIKVLKYEEPLSAGGYLTYWDGRDESGDFVEYGNYMFGLWAYRVADNSIIVNGGRPELTGLRLSPIEIYPYDSPYKTGDNFPEAKIEFDISCDANASIYICDSSGSIVRALLDRVPVLQGHQVFHWDCRTDSGNMLRNGDYRVVIQAERNNNYSETIILHTRLFF